MSGGEFDWGHRHCDHSGELQAIRLFMETSTRQQEKIMTALQSLQDADTALKAEVTTAIQDWAAQLANANSANDPAIQAVADDMNAQVAALQGADTGTASSTGGAAAGTTSTPTAAPTPGTSN